MVRKIFFFVIIVFIWRICDITYPKIEAADFHKQMTPIIDNKIFSDLDFKYCRGYESYPDWNNKELQYSVPEKAKNEFKSKKWTRIEELWKNKQNRSLTIYRWYFDYPEDAALFAESFPVLLGSSFPFDGWSKAPDIGDKTSWWGDDIVVFTKGKVLVKIVFNTGINTTKEPKLYLRRIAEYIAKKL